MLTNVVLGGYLGRRFGRVWKLDLDVPSPAEAVRALSAVCRGFKAFLLERSEPGYHVFAGREDLSAEDLDKPTGRRVITIMPALAGAKSGWFQVILGSVLIVGGAALAIFSAGTLATIGFSMALTGASMVLGGASQLLAAAPSPAAKENNPANEPDYVFSGPVNTTGIGHPVPILYGQLEIGSQVISAGIAHHAGLETGGNSAGDTEGPDGTPGGGGFCPAPWVPILLADGSEVPAGELLPGMRVRTQHEHTLEWGDFEVEAVSFHEAWRWRLVLEDGREFSGSAEHRVRVEDGWKEISGLQGGERLLGSAPGVVSWSAPEIDGRVVRITVKDAHTYVSCGFLSHNAKKSPDIG
jgi:predicted phage tail protein